MSLNQSYFDHLTAGSDTGRDTMDLLCDKTLKELSNLTLLASKSDSDQGVLVLADFYQSQAEVLFNHCYFDTQDGDDKTQADQYLSFMFQLQRSTLDNFLYLNCWNEQNNANQNARLALELLRTWDPFLSSWQKDYALDNSTCDTTKSTWELYFGTRAQVQPVAEQIIRQGKTTYFSILINLPIEELIFSITAILRLWQAERTRLSEDEYVQLTQSFLEKSKILPSNWDFWTVLFEDTEEFTIDMKLQSIQIWPQVISSFLQSWTNFGKKYFSSPIEASNNVEDSDLQLVEIQNFAKITKSGTSSNFKYGRICITGKLGLGREEITELLNANGWQITKSITKDTDYLLTGFKPGSKLDEANNKQIQVIDWAGLLELMSIKNFVSSVANPVSK